MADPAVYNTVLKETKAIQTTTQEKGLALAIAGLAEEPGNPANWSLMPLLSNPAGCLCVVNTSTRFGCGVGCTWTVPSGTSKVQFQLWGPGASTMNGMCCAGSPTGATGAFATVIIDANPGDSYTLCAGCAACCYGYCSQGYAVCGSSTYVNGPGLSGLCAESGHSRISCGMKDLHGGSYSQCRFRGVGSSNQSGPCICEGGTWYCFDNSCASCGVIPFTGSEDNTFSGTATSGTVYGLPATWGGGCFDTNHYGYMQAPPVIGPCHTAQPNSCCCYGFSSGSCCGGCRCRAQDGHRCYPGAGGTYTHMMGGSMYWSGDYGRAGMVRVTWC